MPRGPLWQTCMEQRQALWGHYEWQCKGVEVRRDSIAAVLSSRSLANFSQVQRWDPERSQAQIMPIIALFNSTNTFCVSLETALLKKKETERQKALLSNMCLMSCVLSLLVPQVYNVSIRAERFDQEVSWSRKEVFLLLPLTLSLQVSRLWIWTKSVPDQPTRMSDRPNQNWGTAGLLPVPESGWDVHRCQQCLIYPITR